MEHKNNVKINWKTGLTSLVETFWAIGTSIAAAGVLHPKELTYTDALEP